MKERDWFSKFAFEVFHEYFLDRSTFDTFVDSMAADEEKSRFLKVASFYKFLVKDGRFSVPGYEDAKYFDQTSEGSVGGSAGSSTMYMPVRPIQTLRPVTSMR